MLDTPGTENARDEFSESFKEKFPAVLKTFGKEFIFSGGGDRSKGDEAKDEE